MSEKKTIRRHSSSHHEIGWEDRALWVFKVVAGRFGVELHAHYCAPETREAPMKMLAVDLAMSPSKAREVAQGLLAAADFYDKQSERLAAARREE